MKTNKIFSFALVLALILSLVACGGTPQSSADPSSDTSPEASTEVSAPVSEESSTTEGKVLVVGASPSPHSEILEAVKPILAEQGITLEIQEFSDYVLPNLALADGSLDANYFQHEPYLIDFNEGNNTDLVAAGFIHYEPMGLYPGKTASIDALVEGAKIAVPNDATNEARALLLLEAQGLIKLKEGAGIKATPIDIEENPLKLEIVEVEASQTPAVLPDVDLAVINSNYALEAGVVDTVIVVEDENSVAVEYANVIAVASGNENSPEILALVAALKSQAAKDFIAQRYGKAIIPFEG